jgi:ribosomal protein S18 acetylase RimI-like enzyme
MARRAGRSRRPSTPPAAARTDQQFRRLQNSTLKHSEHFRVVTPTSIAGILVLLPKPDHLLLDNIAVAPAHQGLGLGRRLLRLAEEEAVRRGYCEIRLYRHKTMTENQRLYAAIGHEETGRGIEAGYERFFMSKRFNI